jgi:sterol desaturase/sphingolipid hydroxylase (fatty acid hydroxylase superfamily)
MDLQHVGLAVLIGGFALVAIAETLWPRYDWTWQSRLRHGGTNLALWLLLLAAFWLLNPLILAPAREMGSLLGVGLLNLVSLPYAVAFAIGFLFADFSDYLLHRASHQWRPLWLLHAVHHSDPHLDATTSLRQHPLFYVPAFLLRAVFILAIGAPIEALIVRDIAGVANSHLHHAAIAWTPNAVQRWQRMIGWLIVTPAAHWMHHAPNAEFTNSNYGQVLSLWDRLFGTFRAPVIPDGASGLDALRDPKWHTLTGLLATPWKARKYEKF